MTEGRSTTDTAPGAGPARVASVRVFWVPLLALAAALLTWLSPWQQRWNDGLNDALVRAAVAPAALGELLIIDIDDASLADVLPLLGPWPLRRDVHALAVDFLREAGASVIGIGIVFNDARDGDAVLAAALARPGAPVVLAAAGLRQTVDDQALSRWPAPALAGLRPGAPPATHWPAATAPDAALLAGSSHGAPLGLITTPLSDDGKLRRLPLLHEVGGQLLPAFPLAMQLAAHARAVLQFDADRSELTDGHRRWPLDGAGLAALRFPPAPALAHRVRYSDLAAAMLGRNDGRALREQVRGRAVFIGSTAFFGDAVMTVDGQLHGTELLAGAYAALRDGCVLRPPSAWLDGLLLLLALAPALRCWGRPQPALGPDLRAAGAAVLALGGLAWALLAWQQQLSSLAAPLATLLAGALAAAWSQHRWMARTHQRLAHERSVAEAANRAKTEFMASVSHEIRTPMNALLGVAELLADTPLNQEQQRHVAVFRRAGESLNSLINDLLDLAKIEAGKIELRPEVFALRELLDEQTELMRPRATEKGLLLHFELAPGLPAFVLGDRQRLGQALLNLLSNAVKFTRHGQVSLVVRAEGAPRVVFTVEDTGVGIAQSKLEAIFQPFTQADDGPVRSYAGTGLGLAITRSLARLMGGDVTVHSTPGQGTRFELSARLPAAEAPALRITPLPERGEAAAGAAAAPLHLLLADDNAANVYIIEAMLREDQHHIDTVTDGLLAVDRVRGARYDLVLMDVQMPGMDGYSATREIRRIEAETGQPAVPVIVISAHAYDEDIVRSRAAGATEHLCKPLTRQALRAAIARHRPVAPAGLMAPAARPAPVDILLDPTLPVPVPTSALPPWVQQLAAGRLIDTDAALQRMEGNLVLYRSVLEHAAMFFTTWSRSFRNACAESDREQALRLSHDLKGIAATIGADALAAVALDYDEQLRQGMPAGLGPPLDQVEQALRPVLVRVVNVLRDP